MAPKAPPPLPFRARRAAAVELGSAVSGSHRIVRPRLEDEIDTQRPPSQTNLPAVSDRFEPVPSTRRVFRRRFG